MNSRSDPNPSILEITDAHRLNHEAGEAYPETLYGHVPPGPRPELAVDLGAIELLSSRGVRILVNLKRRVERMRGRLVLFRVRPGVLHQMRTTRLAAHFPQAPDRLAALELLRSAPPM